MMDPACKALSPAVNDPYTAIQAIEHMGVLFAALAVRPAGPLVVHDTATGTAVGVPARTFAEHLSVGIGPIRRFGASEPTVMRTLLRLLSTTLYACGEDPDRWEAIECQMNLLTAAAERETVERADLAPVHAEADAASPSTGRAAGWRRAARTRQHGHARVGSADLTPRLMGDPGWRWRVIWLGPRGSWPTPRAPVLCP